MKTTIEGHWLKDFHRAATDDAQVVSMQLSYDGTAQLLNEEQLAHYKDKHFTLLCFEFSELFAKYRDTHIMADVLEKLKSGMDDISCDLIEHHERMVELTRLPNQYLVNKEYVWTNEDKKRIKLYEECKAQGTPRMLQHVDLTWGTSYINCYGLYDLPQKAFDSINGKAIIDAGGFIGDTITVFRDKFPESICHSFEPVEKNFNYMTRLFTKDIKAGKVIPVQKALGDKAERMKITKMDRDDKIYANSSLLFDFDACASYEEVDVITLDSYVKQHNLEVGLIKMDVEGFEPQIVQGALETIKTQRPILAISCYHTPEEFYELKPYLESLNLGYKFSLRHSTLIMPLGDLVIVAYPED